MADRTVSVRLLLNSAGFVAGSRAASTAIAGVGTRAQATAARARTGMAGLTAGIRRTGTSMANVAAQAGLMRTGLVNPITAAGAAVIGVTKAAIDWESAFAGVQKTVDGTTTQMAGLEDELRQMATELPASHQEIAAVAEAAGQLGVRREDITGFTRTMIDLGESTNLSATEAATSIARMTNIMGTSQADVSRLGSALVDLGNNSATTEREILEFSTRLAAAGQIAGLSESDVLAFGATLTSVGVEAEAGGTALSKTFIGIRDAVIDGGEKLETFARVAGVSAQQFAAAFREDPAQAIALFIEGLGRLNASGQSTTAVFEDLELTDQRLMRALLSTAEAGDLLTDSIELGSRAWEENTALAEEAQRRYDTMASQLQVAWNKVKDAAIDAGEVTAPAAVRIAEAIAGVTGFLAEADRQMQDFSGTFEGTGNHWERIKNVLTGGAEEAEEGVDSFLTRLRQGVESEIPNFLDSIIPAADEMDEFGRTAEEATEHLEAYLDEIRAATDPVFALNQAFENVAQTQRDSKDAIRELERAQEDLDELRGDSEASARDLEDAERRVEDAQRAVEESGWAVVEALTELEQRALDGDLSFEDFSRKLDDWVESGAITEAQAEAIRERVGELTGAAEDYQGDYNARVLLDNFRQVTSQLDGVERRAIEASKDRTARIGAQAWGVGHTERTLNSLARDRFTTIRVGYAVTGSGLPAGLVRGHTGGQVVPGGLRRFHDGGPVRRFHNGSDRLRSDEVPAILQTGEVVLSRSQVGLLSRALAPVVGPSFHNGGVVGGGSSVNLHAHFHGPVGSQLELENWLARSVDNLSRKGRISAVTR